MTATINASTSSGVVITPDNSGNILLQYNGVSTPTFSAYQSSAQNGIANATPTKITFDVEEFDTANCFSSSRFTPTVAGYYLITAGLQIPYNAYTHMALTMVYKNGSAAKQGAVSVGNPVAYPQSIASVIMYLNGSTDYVEIYGYGYNSNSSTFNTQPGADRTWFQACLLRGA
jgi:hypothetical protein